MISILTVIAFVAVDFTRSQFAFSRPHRDFQLLPQILIISADISDDRGRDPLSSYLYMIELADYFPKFVSFFQLLDA